MKGLLTRIRAALFGDGLPIQRREAEPATRSEKFLAYAGAAFLISVACYLPTRIYRDMAWCQDRKMAVLERCVLSTKDFRWCWINLGPI